MPEVRRHGSVRGGGGGGGAGGLELLLGPLGLAGLGQHVDQRGPQRDQQLDVERGVDQPVVGQRPGAPVVGRVALLQADAEVVLDHGAQRDPFLAEQPAGEFGVEQPRRAQAQFGQAGQVLVGRVQDPLDAARARALSSLRSGTAIGSISTVP